ncbi:MAG: hypothetical protein IPN77_15405 [Sandaracinaceae bacterium]|nr:hypothetical protein [Sandaracinaceae bacterium]
MTPGDRVILLHALIPGGVWWPCWRYAPRRLHSVVFGGFAAAELATRIDDAKPVLTVCASCGIEPTRTVAYQAAAGRGHLRAGVALAGAAS